MSAWDIPAVEVRTAQSPSDLVLLCEHASNYIPQAYARLGLSDLDLERHIAWDIGAAPLTRALAERLDAVAFLGTYSRLLIDLNRPLGTPSSIAVRSEDTGIPGNAALPPSERRWRENHLFRPFHQRVSDHLDRRAHDGLPTRIVSIHSFTPVYAGEPRDWEGGVLFGESLQWGESLVRALRSKGVNVGANVPYKTDRLEDYSVPVHGDDRGLPAVLIEIRNDMLASASGINAWTNYLSDALTGPAGYETQNSSQV